MNDIDEKILEAINTVSPKSFVSPIRVNEILKLDLTELGNRFKASEKIRSCRYYYQRLFIKSNTSKFYLKSLHHRIWTTKLEEKKVDCATCILYAATVLSERASMISA